MDKVNIVIITYSSARHIGKCLRSIEQYPFTSVKYSIIVHDNNSSDNSCEIVNSYRNVVLIRNNENIGFASAVNKVILNCHSKYILLLNPDTEIKENSLDTIIKTLITEKADICGGKMIGENKYVHKSCVRIPTLLIGLFDFTNLMKLFQNNTWHRQFYYLDTNIQAQKNTLAVDAVSGGYMLFLRNIYTKVGGFDDKYFMYLEDVDFCRKAKSFNAKILYCPQSIIWHEGGGSSTNTKKINYDAWCFSRRYFFAKNSTLLSNIIIQPIFWIDKIITDVWRIIKKT